MSQKIMKEAQSCCKTVTKQQLLDHVQCIQDKISQLPDPENSDSVAKCCHDDECVASSLGVTCAALCTADMSITHTLKMIEECEK